MELPHWQHGRGLGQRAAVQWHRPVVVVELHDGEGVLDDGVAVGVDPVLAPQLELVEHGQPRLGVLPLVAAVGHELAPLDVAGPVLGRPVNLGHNSMHLSSSWNLEG